MPELREGIYRLNAGEVSRYALAEIDLAKLRVACEQQENFLPLVLGPALMRPGTQFIARGSGDLAAQLIEFKMSARFAALLVLTTDGKMQILDAATDTFVTRGAVSTAVTNGDFTTTITGWTDSSEAGASISWAAGSLALLGTGPNYAYADQFVVANPSNVEHALRIIVARGDVAIKVGINQGSGEYWDIEVPEGQYSLAFVPTGNFWIRLGARAHWVSLVDQCTIEPAGVVSLLHPWSATLDDLQYTQINDVIFVACNTTQQRRIERRNTFDMRSWALAFYRADDGPFQLANLGSTSLTPSGTSGGITLTASRRLFQTGHVGALFRLTHSEQTQTAVLAGANQFTAPIRISGVDPGRAFAIGVTGRVNSTITLQRSFTDPGAWTFVATYDNGSFTYDDALDNQIYWYRIGIVTGQYGTDTVNVALNHAGAQTGIVRIIQFFSDSSVSANVLTQLGGVTATTDWAEGEWSDTRGWPVAVAEHDGRLYWQCRSRIQGSVTSVSGDLTSFDDKVIGDSAPINRTTVTSEPRWLLSGLRLLIGAGLQERAVRASSLDEPLTSAAFAVRTCDDHGAARGRAMLIDGRAYFVGRDGIRVFELGFDVARQDFAPREVTRLKQEMCAPGVVSLAAQRQPDFRIYVVLSDGRMIVIVNENQEDVAAMVPYTFGSDTVERVAVLPGLIEDKVYVYVHRGGARCIERFAYRSEVIGGSSGINKVMDSHTVYSGASTSVINVPTHLIGRSVVVWSGGPIADQSAPLTVSGAATVTLPYAVTAAVIGLPYNGLIKTAKLASATQTGTSLTTQKRIGPIGLVLADVGWYGVHVGRDFTHMTRLPATYRGRPLANTEVIADWDAAPASFSGAWSSDPRVCIKVEAPYPCTVLGIVFGEAVYAGEDVQVRG